MTSMTYIWSFDDLIKFPYVFPISKSKSKSCESTPYQTCLEIFLMLMSSC